MASLCARFARQALVFVAAAALVGCGPRFGPGADPAPRPTPEVVDQRLVAANTRFSFDLFHAVRAADAGKNIFLSPASASLVLSLTYNGAVGETQQGMAKALGLEGLTPSEVNQGNADMQALLANPDPRVQLSIANSVWYKQGYKLNPTFADIGRTHYQTEIQALDFGSRKALPTMNGWVARATRDKIPNLLDRIDPSARMILINAIYLNAEWQEPFNPENTRPRSFTRPDGTTKQVPMMSKGGIFRYLQGDNFQAVALPYGDGRVNMYLFLPDSGVTLEQFFQGLTAENWTAWMAQFGEKQGSVIVPKLKLDYAAELKEPLIQMGMALAFDGQKANFSNLFQGNPEPLYIGRVLQKTHIDIHEKGTEAAAATVVEVKAGSARPEDPFSMVIDRPYFLAMCDDKTGEILFLGSILDPQ